MLLLSDLWKLRDLSLLPLPTQASLQAWRHLNRDHAQCDISMKVSFPISILECMIPMIDTKPLTQCGISVIMDLHNQSNLKTLRVLEEEFNLP